MERHAGTGRAETFPPTEAAIGLQWIRDPHVKPIADVARQLQAYFDGDLKQFDLPIDPQGTPFQQLVWKELCNIPYGITISYGELAARIGNPKGSRAVGLANGRNPISIIVPCHRVIGANGKLVGYGGGLDRKIWLLELEQGCNTLIDGAVRPIDVVSIDPGR